MIANGVDVRHSRKGPLYIGKGVVVGHGSTILSGVFIGEGTVIGASSLVVAKCDPFSIYAGNPAKKIKERSIDRNAFDVFMSGSVSTSLSYLTGILMNDVAHDADPEDRVHIKVQFVDPVKGGAFLYQVVGAKVGGKYYRLVEGSDFFNYWKQAKLPAGSEMTWIDNPLGLSME